jgi:hypothetical protein
MEAGEGQQYFHVCLLSASLSSWRAHFTRYLSARKARPTIFFPLTLSPFDCAQDRLSRKGRGNPKATSSYKCKPLEFRLYRLSETRTVPLFPLRQQAENAYTAQARKGGELCKCTVIDNVGGNGELVSRWWL